jgi:hypothetical protein
VAAPAASAPSTPPRADREPTTADAATVKQEAQAELARARSEAEAARAARAQADAEAAANRVRGQALADAARIRAEAVEAAARTRTDATAATRDAGSQGAPRTAPSAPANAAVAATASIAADKIATAPAVATAGGTRFDGAWSVSVACEPMGTGALAYKFDFVAQVKDNFLRGERLAEGSPGWLKLQGPIQPDGKATLDAQGLTDDPKYSNGVAHGTPYAYHVAAHFDSDRGTGRRLEMRACNLSFAKQ